MEKADRVLVVEAGFDWDDVGSWHGGRELFQERRGKEREQLRITALDSTDNIVSIKTARRSRFSACTI